MSLNTLNMGTSITPPLLPGEQLVDPPHLTPGFLTDLELRIPATMEGPKRTMTGSGKLWITSQRVIYVSNDAPMSNSSSAPAYAAGSNVIHSLVIPYATTMSCTYHLPTFSANHLLVSFQPDITPDQRSSLPSPGRGGKYEAKLIVGNGQSHAVWKRIEGEMERYRDKTRDDETLPAYSAK